MNPAATSFPLCYSSLYTFKEISLKICLNIHTPSELKFQQLYWKVLPNKNLASALCMDFPCGGCCPESQHFGEWYCLSVKGAMYVLLVISTVLLSGCTYVQFLLPQELIKCIHQIP